MKVYGWTTDDQHPVMALGVLKKKTTFSNFKTLMSNDQN